jgi:hypothetical protein
MAAIVSSLTTTCSRSQHSSICLLNTALVKAVDCDASTPFAACTSAHVVTITIVHARLAHLMPAGLDPASSEVLKLLT